MKISAPYGSWKSLVSAELVVSGAVGYGEVISQDNSFWWAESRPNEGGRVVIVRDGVEAVPDDVNVRTLVHEYGGGAWTVAAGSLIYSDYEDQRLRKIDSQGHTCELTPEPETERGLRYANGVVTPSNEWFICVQELSLIHI